jgi:transposase
VAAYLTLMTEAAPQRVYALRDIFDALRWLVKTGSPWRYLPGDYPPWTTVYQQTQRWIKAGSFEALAMDLRVMLRQREGRPSDPSAVILDGRTLQSTPESGQRAGYDGHKRRKGSKVHMAVDTLGHLLALTVTPANEQAGTPVWERAQVAELAKRVQEATGDSVTLAYVDQGYTGQTPKNAAAEHGIDLCVVKLEEAKNGFALLPRRWVVERSFAWASRFRRLARDYERLPETVAALHFVALGGLMLARVAHSAKSS